MVGRGPGFTIRYLNKDDGDGLQSTSIDLRAFQILEHGADPGSFGERIANSSGKTLASGLAQNAQSDPALGFH